MTIKAEPTSPAKPSQADSSPKPATSAFRREFKIYGAIDSKSGVSFISLVRQINTGLEKGYTNGEIADAIIRAVPANTGLRNYLEGKQSLTLPALRQILRAHYKEKSTTELFAQLGQLAQSPTEDAQEYLLRSLELRQKILFTSLEKDTDVVYEESLVNKLFKRSFQTGLRSDVIRTDIKAALEGPGVDDEDLIQTLSVISLREEERSNKITPKKTVKVSAVESASCAEPVKKPVKEGTLSVEVRELRAEIEALKKELTPSRQKEKSRGVRGCRACREANLRTCDHCWRCGSADHYPARCRHRPLGNGTESSQGGRG